MQSNSMQAHAGCWLLLHGSIQQEGTYHIYRGYFYHRGKWVKIHHCYYYYSGMMAAVGQRDICGWPCVYRLVLLAAAGTDAVSVCVVCPAAVPKCAWNIPSVVHRWVQQ